jgi:hypothetical protein
MRKVILGTAITLLIVGAIVIVHNALTSQVITTSDFLPRWEGARLLFSVGLSPYSEATNLAIQQIFYGRAAQPGEDLVLFAYPLYTAFVIAPLTALPYAWASAVWVVLLELCVLGVVLLLLRLYNWRPAPWLIPVILLWALTDYFAVRGVFLGQPSHLVSFLQVLTVFAVVRGWDEAAGVALAVSTIKPQMGYLFVPLLLLWALVAGRRRLLLAFGLAFGGLMAGSFIVDPDWLGAWLQQVRLYSAYTAAAYPNIGSPVWIVTRHYLGFGPAAEWVVAALVVAPVLWAWYTLLIERREERWLWAVALTLVAGHMVGLRTATPHFVVFTLLIVFYLKRLAAVKGSAWVAGALLVWVVGVWVQFVLTGRGDFPAEDPSMFLPLPFALYALTLLTRRMWWQHAPQPSERRESPQFA